MEYFVLCNTKKSATPPKANIGNTELLSTEKSRDVKLQLTN